LNLAHVLDPTDFHPAMFDERDGGLRDGSREVGEEHQKLVLSAGHGSIC